MTTVLIVLAVILWWAVGTAGFVFWWTKDYDLTLGEFVFGCIMGLAGPLTWLFGFLIHGDWDPIIVRRQR